MTNWHKIDEVEPPKDGTHILLFIEEAAIEGWWESKTNIRGKDISCWNVAVLSSHGCGCCSYENEDPTHWQPIEPPEDTQ